MLPTDAQRVALHNYPQPPGHSPGYPSPHPPPPSHHQQQHRGDRKLAFGQLRQAVSSRLCDLLDEAGIHATRVTPGRRFVRWDAVPNLLAQQNAYISGLPYEFFFAKAPPVTGPGPATTTANTTSSTSNTAMMTSSSSTNTFAPPGGSNTDTNSASQNTGYYSLPPSQNDDEDDVSMNPFDGMSSISDTGAAFGSLPPLRFPSGAPAYHPHPHASIQVDEGLTANTPTHNHPVNNTAGANPHDTTPPNNADDYDSDDDGGAGDITQTLIAQLHAQPLNINILNWKKQTIEHILDGLDSGRIRVLARPQGRDVVFQLELPSSMMNTGIGAGTVPGAGGGNSGADGGSNGATIVNTVDIPRWPDSYPHAHSNTQSQSYLQGQSGVAFPQQSIGNSGQYRDNNTQFNNSYYNNNGPSPAGGPVRNPRPDRERRRKLSTNTNASTGTGSAGSEATASSWSGGGAAYGYQAYGDQESLSVPDGMKRETLGDERAHDGKGHNRGHGRNGSGSGSGSGSGMTMGGGGGGGPSVVPLVHNHTLTPAPFRSHYQDYPQSLTKQRHAQPQNNGHFGTLQSEGGSASQQPLLAGVQHVSRPILSPSGSSTVGSFLTTPTPTKKWTRRSSPDRIFMNVTLNGILRGAGMPIPRQKDDASRLPWSSIPQFLAENGLYIRGWPEANLPWLYSVDMGARASAIGTANMGMSGAGGASGSGGANGAAGMGERRDRIDWKSSPSQRSYKPLAQALRSGDIQILSRPRERDVLFEVRDAQGGCYDSTLGLSDEWKERYMRDSAVGSASPPAPQASTSGGGDLNFLTLASPTRRHGSNLQVRRQQQRPRGEMINEDEPEEEERERGRPGYHSRSTSYSRSGSSRARNAAMDFDLPSPTETSASNGSGPRRRQGHRPFSSGYHSARTTPPGATQGTAPRAGYQSLAFPSEHAKPSPLAYPYPGKAASFPPNQFHDIHGQPRRSTPPSTSYDRDGPPSGPSGPRFPQLLSRQYSDSTSRFQRPGFPTAEASSGNSCRNTPSPGSSQRQRTVSLGTSSASTGTGTMLPGSLSELPALSLPSRTGRYNLPSISHGALDVDMDLDDPCLNRLPPLIHLNSDVEVREDESRPLDFPTHLPSPYVAFSQPTWSAAERRWNLNVLDLTRASLPPVGDTILWDVERRSWKLTWAADAGSSMEGRPPAALWSTEQDAWILDS